MNAPQHINFSSNPLKTKNEEKKYNTIVYSFLYCEKVSIRLRLLTNEKISCNLISPLMKWCLNLWVRKLEL